MGKRLLFIAVAVIVPIAVLLLAAVPYVTDPDWTTERVHEALTVQLAQSLKSEVRVGSISGNVLTDIEIHDLAISDGRSFEEGTLLSLDSVKVDLDLSAAWKSDRPVIETINEIRISGLSATLSRDGEGALNIQRLLDLRKPTKKPPSGNRFQGRIVFDDAELRFTNDADIPAVLSGLDLHLVNISGTADFKDPRFIDYDLAVACDLQGHPKR